MLPAVTNLQPSPSPEFPPLTESLSLFFSFLSTWRFWKYLSILPNVYSLLTIYGSSSPWNLTAPWPQHPAFGTTGSNPSSGSPAMTATAALPATTVYQMHSWRNVPFLLDLILQKWLKSWRQRSNSSSKLLLWLTGENLYEGICLNELEIFLVFKLTQLLLRKDSSLNCEGFFSFSQFSFLFLQLHCLGFQGKEERPSTLTASLLTNVFPKPIKHKLSNLLRGQRF